MKLEPLTAADLRRTLNRMSSQQACGMDGWRVAELKALPDVLLERLADVLNWVETTATWPAALENALVSLIPKGAGGRPLDLRPISVASVVYRLWAATRCREVMRWQETWIATGQKGFRLGSTCADVFFPLALRIEKALLDGTPLVGFSADWAKCFDRYPHDVMLSLLGETGLDARVLGPLRTMYRNLRRRFRLSGAVGKPFKSTQGLLQGCPLSVCGLTCIMAVLSKAVEGRAPGAKFDSFADDGGACATGRTLAEAAATTQKAIDVTSRFAELTGGEIHMGKSHQWCTARRYDPGLKYRGQPLKREHATI
eukprot:gene9219-8160_t